MLNFNLFHSSQWITFPTQPYLFLLLLLCPFTTFAYHGINCFISVSSLPTLTILQRNHFSLWYKWSLWNYYYLLISIFSHQCWLIVFYWGLSDSKSPQVSRTRLSILVVLNDAVVWMVSTRLITSKSSSPFSNPLVTVSNAPITIGIIVTFMFHSFFDSQASTRYLSLFSHSFTFILWLAGTVKSTILQVLLFCWLLLGLVFWPRLGNLCHSPIGVYVCHFLEQVLGCTYIICWYGQIKLFCTSPCGSLCWTSCV